MAVTFVLCWASPSSAETRTLKLYFIHTKERAEITYKRNGRYDQAGLNKINRFLRDWRRNEPTKMDPRLLDLVWEAYRQVGARDYIHVVSAYRSPATNSMLRSRSKGVAQKSQHMLGKAMDFYIPGVKLQTLRNTAMRLQGGGVGYYPRSGSPFVHLDVGNVRHWPRMSRRELVSIFPNGKTLHVPTDGKPLPGFNQALASYKARRGSGNLAIASASSSSRSGGGLLAAFFGGGADEEEESGGAATAEVSAPRPKARVEEPAVAARKQQIQVLPPELAQPADAAPAREDPAPETIIAALPARDIPLPPPAPRPKIGLLEPEAASAQDALVAAGNAAAQPGAQVGTDVALAVPLPTWRPDYKPPSAVNEAVVMALASPDKPGLGANDATVPLPDARPEAAALALPGSEAVLPSHRPEMTAVGTGAPVEAPGPAVDTNLPGPGFDGLQPTASGAAGKGIRVASLAPSASLRSVAAGRPAGTDALAAIASGVRTTKKAARVSPDLSRPDPQPQVVTAQPEAARWAFEKDLVTRSAGGTKAPSFAYNIVRTAPLEVYTAGFQQDSGIEDPNRFSGKAVQFLAVARFHPN